MIDGTPKIQTFEAVTSAFHRIRPEAWHFCYDAYETWTLKPRIHNEQTTWFR